MVRVLFVCLGNICRSPMAEGILRKRVSDRGLEDRFEIDSCGTGGWHEGEGADARTVFVLGKYGASFTHAARQIRAEDIDHYDHLLVMDKENLRAVKQRFPQAAPKTRLVMDLGPFRGLEVPDPYYGDLSDFERVYAMLDAVLTAFADEAGRGAGSRAES